MPNQPIITVGAVSVDLRIMGERLARFVVSQNISDKAAWLTFVNGLGQAGINTAVKELLKAIVIFSDSEAP